MRKVALGLAAVVLLIVVVLIALPAFVPASAYKGRIEAAAAEALGRPVTIGDDLALSLFPRFRFSVDGLEIANAPGMSDRPFASVEAADIGVDLLPLLGGRVVIDRFVLVRPEINLERNAKGEVNWMLGAAERAPEEPDAPQEAELPQDVNLGDVRLVDGVLTYADAVENTAYAARDINLDIALSGLADPLKIDGGLVFEDRPVSLDVRIDTIRAIQNGEAADIRANLSLADAKVRFNATTIAGEAFAYAGDLDVDAPSVRDLLSWVGAEAPMAYGFGPLQVSGALSGGDTALAFENAKLRFDDINGAGRLAANWSSDTPSLTGALTLKTLDLRPYAPPTQSQSAGLAPWSDEPIDFSGMKTVDLDFEIDTDAILLPTLTIDESALKATLKDGRLTADLTSLSLYGGSGSGELTLDGRRAAAALTGAFQLSGLQAQPFVKDASGFDVIRGVADLSLDLKSSGRSQAQLVNGLAGAAAFSVKDGALVGVNLAQLARTVGAFKAGGVQGLLAQASEGAAQTDFAEFSASALIVNGVARTDNIRLVGPFIRAAGGGQVNLSAQTVDLRLTPQITTAASSADPEPAGAADGAEAAAEPRTFGAPLLIRGKLDSARVTVDAAATSAATGTVKSACGTGSTRGIGRNS